MGEKPPASPQRGNRVRLGLDRGSNGAVQVGRDPDDQIDEDAIGTGVPDASEGVVVDDALVEVVKRRYADDRDRKILDRRLVHDLLHEVCRFRPQRTSIVTFRERSKQESTREVLREHRRANHRPRQLQIAS